MTRAATLTVDDGLATLRIAREHGNAINGELVDALAACCREIEERPEIRGVLLAARGKLFCPGLDLQELLPLEREPMARFLRRFNAAMLALYTLSRPVVAALHGHALAGGCVLGLTADWRVLARGALCGLNEVQVGVPLPFGVALLLQASVAPEKLEEVALFGRNYADEAALAAGLAHELHEADGFEEHCRARLGELAERDGRALAITKRYLRSATVERIRAFDAQFEREFLEAWFSAPTRERIRAIVERLRAG